MFASRKSSLIKQLWRKKIFNQNDETNGEVETSVEVEWKNHLHRILKRLKEKQLEVLLQSIESKGGETTECVLVPVPQDRKNSSTLCCRVWRWPEAEQPLQLKRMCVKTSDDTDMLECINPYHWSRLLIIGKFSK